MTEPRSPARSGHVFGELTGWPDRLPSRAVLAAGLAVGLGGDLLLRESEGPGLNVFLLFVVLGVSVQAVSRRAGRPPGREAAVSLAVGIVFAAALVVRASPVLQLLAFLGAALAFALPALRGGLPWVRRGGVSDQIEAVAGAVVWSVLGASRLAAEGLTRGGASEGPGGRGGRRAMAVLRGGLLALPFLLVFGALFMSADRVFARIMIDLVRVDLEVAASHVVLTGVLAWLSCGYLIGFITGTRVRGLVEERIPRPSAGIVEVGVALGLIDLLFAAFVAVQLRYLFGGGGLVEVTPGLTYAEYTREGFVQLAVASALVLPALMASDWLLRRVGPRDEAVFRALGGLQLLLLMVVVASALQRVRAYLEAYGLTESRFYGVAFLGWLTLLGVWFAVTVLRGRRDRFAFPVLASALVAVALLFVLNPDVRIVRANLERAGIAVPSDAGTDRPEQTRGSAGVPLDAAYLTSLGADAVPTLLRVLPGLSADARCTVARGLLRRWGPERSADWRGWNWAVQRARSAVRAEVGRLRGMARGGDDCP